jgi:type I restriction enzyme, S subunit
MILERTPLHIPSGFEKRPSDWSWSRLDDVCEGIYDCPHSTPKLAENGPLMVRTQDVITGIFRRDQAAHVSAETYRERTQRVQPTFGDLLYSREGTYFGIAAEVPPNTQVCLGQRMVLIRPQESKVDFRYLRFWLNSPIMVTYIHGFRDGSVAERLNLPTIRALPVFLPTLREQKTISHILGTLDDKIELTRRMNKTLEAIAEALFKSWFVVFDPVRVLSGKMQEKPPFLCAEVLRKAGFPDRFQDSELGEIPEGWRSGGVGDFGAVICGKTPPTGDAENYGTGIPFVTIPDMHGKVLITDTERSLSEIGAATQPTKTLPPYAICVSCIATVGLVALTSEPCQTNQQINSVVPSESHDSFYCYFALRELVHEIRSRGSGGSVVLNLNKAQFASLPVLLPPRVLEFSFKEIVQPIFEKILANERECRTLAALRDLLLPKLLSGELSVAKARVEIEATL